LFTFLYICKYICLQLMKNTHKLLIEQLDKKLGIFSNTREIVVPERGLGARLNITRQGVKRIEESEANATITLNSLKDVAQALDMRLVYALVPKNGNVDDLIQAKADALASKIVLRTNQTMKLEDQGIGDEKLAENIKELAYELKREMKKSLWD